LNPSLSVVLPVHNAEPSLEHHVEELLEIVAELTTRVEVVIVDDASTDQTADVASELQRRYPQVKCVPHACRQGWLVAFRTGIRHSQGSVVLVHDVADPLSGAALQQLWALRDEESLVLARVEAAPTTPLRPPHLPAVHPPPTPTNGLQMIRRAAVMQLRTDALRRVRTPGVTRIDIASVPAGDAPR
jgi:glycosyltransferase involved in cell wall biosynthesis